MQNMPFPKHFPDALAVNRPAGDLTITRESNRRIEELIRSVTQDLDWSIEYVHGERESYEIEFEKQKKKHVIYVPVEQDQFHNFHILHELGHAVLYEKHGFGCGEVQDDKGAKFKMFSSILRLLDDWFLTDWLMGYAPDAVQVEIETEYERVTRSLQSQVLIDPYYLVLVAFYFALCVKFLGWTMRFGSDLQKIVDAFISVPPARWTITNAEKLANSVLEACPGIAFKVRAYRCDAEDGSKGVVVWDFIEGNSGKPVMVPGTTLDVSVYKEEG